MKPIFRKVTQQPEYSFSFRQDEVPFFFNIWHYHPEIELVWIRKGTGTRFIGDSIERFTEGDIVLLGENLPHFMRSDAIYFENNPELTCHSTVIHFRPDFMGQGFLNLPEMKNIKQCLKKAEKGFFIEGETRIKLQKLLTELSQEGVSNTDHLIGLLKILNIITASKDLTPISDAVFSDTLYAEKDALRINRIYTYVIEHFDEEISLETIAEVANISPNSFCRYFKTKTQKTFSQFLLEVRIGHACKMLIENQKSIGQICYECGFNTLSNFNRYFKKIKNQTPSEFMKQFN